MCQDVEECYGAHEDGHSQEERHVFYTEACHSRVRQALDAAHAQGTGMQGTG